MDERKGGYGRLGNALRVQQPCTEEKQMFLFNDGTVVQLNHNGNTVPLDLTSKMGKRLAPRVNIGESAVPVTTVDKERQLPWIEVSKNLKPVQPDNDVVDLTLATTESPLDFSKLNIPNLNILNPTETKNKKVESPEPPKDSMVEIAEPYVEIRKRREHTPGFSRVCQEVSLDQFGISLRVPKCDPLQEFPGLQINSPEDEHPVYYDTSKLLTNPKKTVYSTFQKGLVVHGNDVALNQFMDQHKLLVTGTHGILTTKALNPSYYGSYSGEMFGEFEVQESLGEGGFGKVQLCVDKVSRKMFVRKEIFNGFKNTEVLLLQQLNHVNITKLFGFIQREGTPEVIMEYAGINLLMFTLVPPTSGYLNDGLIWNFCNQGLSALEYLDIRGIIHLDVKPENFCVFQNDDGSNTLKLTDFGSAKTPRDPLTYTGWTAEYMSPEACFSFLQNRFPQKFQENPDYQMSGKSDVYSLALTILFLYSRTHVLMKFFTNGASSYKDADRKQTQLQILIALAQKPDIVRDLMMPDECCPQMKELLKSLLEGCPVGRPSAFDALIRMQEIKNRESVPLTIKDDLQEKSVTKAKAKTKRVRKSRKSSSRESQSSRYSTDMIVSSGSLMNSFNALEDEMISIRSPASPGNPDSPGGPVRCRSVKTKLRQRLSCPYTQPQNIQDNATCTLPSNSNDEGNFPHFALLD